MNTLLRKELRLLLPAWIAALVAATVPLWSGRFVLGLSVPCFGLAALFLGLTPFGQEMSCGTFGLLLSQPEKRQRFWRIKAGLLALALVSVWALFASCCWIDRLNLKPWQFTDLDSFAHMAGVSGLLALLAFSGGLWSTLLLRDVTTAFFATVLVPMAIFSGSVVLWASVWQNPNWFVICLPLGIYAAAGFFVARRLFLGAEDVAWTGGQVSLASAGGRPFRWLGFGFREKRGPWSALILKELQLQEVTMVVVPLLALLHLAALAARHFAPQWSARMAVLDSAGFLWLAAPFVVGCVAMAEERRHNTLEGSLCLPVRKRGQFAVKFAVVMALGTVLGGVVPWALEYFGGSDILPDRHAMLQWFLLVAAGISAISFFASTMSRGMLQAFAVASLFPTALGVAGGLLLALFMYHLHANVINFGGLLLPLVAGPALLAAYFWMAFRNYTLLQTGWRLWAGNFARFAAVFAAALLVASAIYTRPWEYVMALEPPHGPARLEGSGRAKIASSGSEGSYSVEGSLFVLLPDGRLWAGKKERAGPHEPMNNLSGHFAGGSNWLDLVGSHSGGAVALQSDGTLWKLSRGADPRQIGSDSDWKQVVAGQNWFLALKSNGTIWGWGDNDYGILGVKTPDEKGHTVAFSDPVQVWPDSDWVSVLVPGFGEAMAVKRDGSVWKWGEALMFQGSGKLVFAQHQLARVGLEGTNWSSLADDSGLTVGVRADGSLWAGCTEPFGLEVKDPKIFGDHVPRGARARPVRIGTKSDWVGVSMGYFGLVALDGEGAFWAIDRASLDTTRPSKCHDWLAATAVGDKYWAVARDGTICCWEDCFWMVPYSYSYSDEPHSHWFVGLRPSRRPLASLNILDAE
jgi:hypothetical protein